MGKLSNKALKTYLTRANKLNLTIIIENPFLNV